ncbi:MAG: TorF family putative porin, partial [Candidatus Azotimanducaceae bacterium WSBS_2022_MAG_OTU7]
LLAASALMPTSVLAEGEVSYNIGFASEYYYRGILQKDASASAGIDYENSGFYAGAWTADVGDGVEVDGYFGYGVETDAGFSASLGFTGYYYTGEFDDTYEEINLNLGYKIVSLEYSVGEWDGFGAEEDYDFLAVTVESESGFYGKYGTFGDEFDGDYVEVGYGTTIADFDVGISAIFSSDELSDQLDDEGDDTESEAVVFTIGKAF